MAKQSFGSKSDAVRDYLEKNPEARNVDVVNALAKRGYPITPALVSNLRSGAKSKAKPRAVTPTVTKATVGEGDYLSKLLVAQTFIREMGGYTNARQVIDTLEQLRQD